MTRPQAPCGGCFHIASAHVIRHRNIRPCDNKLTSLCANTKRSLILSIPPYWSSSHFLYFSTVCRKIGHSTPQTKPLCFHLSAGDWLESKLLSLICWSSHVTTCSHRWTHLSQFCQTNGPASRSSFNRSIPSWSSRIRLAICFDVSIWRSSFAVSALACKNSSNRPLVNVPRRRGPIRFRASRCRIFNSDSLSMRCST